MARRSLVVPKGSEQPIDWILKPFQQFARVEASAGILLLACTALALVWANWPGGGGDAGGDGGAGHAAAWEYDHFWHTPLSVGFGTHAIRLSLGHFVNDGLMAIFFFVVGLEIKRELIAGELASPRKAVASIAAAIGGMAVPALVYFAFNRGGAEAQGWAIPMATDIAFAMGVMAIIGKRVPIALKILLTAAAIVDDIGAVVVIAIFYTDTIDLTSFLVSGAAFAASIVASRLGVRSPVVYGLIGLVLWVMMLQSGVHATVAGVLLALTIPARVRIDGAQFTGFGRRAAEEFEKAGGNVDDIMTNSERLSVVHALQEACERVQTPLNRLEHVLHPWVSFLIMPVFALANAGIELGGGFGDALGAGVAFGVGLGLVIGKPIGFVGAIWIAAKLGLCRLPEGASARQIAGAGCLAGIGFTMSLFIANLAFPPVGAEADLNHLAKVGILAGSLISGVAGFVLLRGKRGHSAFRPAPIA